MIRHPRPADELAIHGGPKIRPQPMPKRRSFGPDERAMVVEAMDHYQRIADDLGYDGLYERRYCEAFAAFQGGGFADAVATGTGAIYVALGALDLPRGSKVLVSPITDPGTISAIILQGLTPLLCDAEPDSYNIAPREVAARLTDDTTAILVVHCTGKAVDMDGVMTLARGRGVKVLEDCSQSHGARWNGRPIGCFGDIAAFSTMYRKVHMTGSSGGVVYAMDEAVFHRALAHADRGKPRWRADFDDRNPATYLLPALNWHADELACAIGIASLARIRQTIDRRQVFLAQLAEQLGQRSRFCRPCFHGPDGAPFFLPILVDQARISCDVGQFAAAIKAEGIDLNSRYGYVVAEWDWARPHFADGFDTPQARQTRDASFCLYLNENYGTPEAEDIAAAIEKVEAHFGV